jgi:hypothetical protein
MITVAQVVEAVHAAEDSINLIDQILAGGLEGYRSSGSPVRYPVP